MFRNYLKIIKCMKPHIPEVQRTPSEINYKQANATVRLISPIAENERSRKNPEGHQRGKRTYFMWRTRTKLTALEITQC